MTSGLEVIKHLKWIDGRRYWDIIQPYLHRSHQAAFERNAGGSIRYNLGLEGRAKKNWKSAKMTMDNLGAMMEDSPFGSECYQFANDEEQAGDDLALAKKIVEANPALDARVIVRDKAIYRKDDRGFLKIQASKDVAGAHGKTYRRASFDEIHGYRNWDLLEAMQLDPNRPDAQMWITSYASIYHKPGVPLFDLCALGRSGRDPRIFFSWYAADYTTDPDFANALPEQRANPSMASWADPHYLEQQHGRIPGHKYRRLHLNLPGLPEGSAFQPDPILAAVARGVICRPYESARQYKAFVDMSHGSSDDAVLAIGYIDEDGRAVVARVMNQGQAPPFNAYKAIPRFVAVLKEYGVSRVQGDNAGGETYKKGFEELGIAYTVEKKSKSQLYEALEPRLNAYQVSLVDVPEVEQQLLGLLWRGGKIDHPGGEHDDFANACAGLVVSLLPTVEPRTLYLMNANPVSARTEEELHAEVVAQEKAAAIETVNAAIRTNGIYWPG